MSFEVRKGRSCDSLQVLNENIIKSQGQQLINQSELIRLTESKSLTLESLLMNQKESKEILVKQFQIDLKREKRKTKRWRKVAVIETIGIVIGVILLL